MPNGAGGINFAGVVGAGNSDLEERMKRIGFLVLLITVTVLFTLALSAAAGPKIAPLSTAPVVATPAAAAPAMPPHPRVHEALEAMRSAREHMAHAEGEFHGHRDKAIEHLDAAIHEAEICEREP
jgi:hypothetical protein